MSVDRRFVIGYLDAIICQVLSPALDSHTCNLSSITVLEDPRCASLTGEYTPQPPSPLPPSPTSKSQAPTTHQHCRAPPPHTRSSPTADVLVRVSIVEGNSYQAHHEDLVPLALALDHPETLLPDLHRPASSGSEHDGGPVSKVVKPLGSQTLKV